MGIFKTFKNGNQSAPLLGTLLLCILVIGDARADEGMLSFEGSASAVIIDGQPEDTRIQLSDGGGPEEYNKLSMGIYNELLRQGVKPITTLVEEPCSNLSVANGTSCQLKGENTVLNGKNINCEKNKFATIKKRSSSNTVTNSGVKTFYNCWIVIK